MQIVHEEFAFFSRVGSERAEIVTGVIVWTRGQSQKDELLINGQPWAPGALQSKEHSERFILGDESEMNVSMKSFQR